MGNHCSCLQTKKKNPMEVESDQSYYASSENSSSSIKNNPMEVESDQLYYASSENISSSIEVSENNVAPTSTYTTLLQHLLQDKSVQTDVSIVEEKSMQTDADTTSDFEEKSMESDTTSSSDFEEKSMEPDATSSPNVEEKSMELSDATPTSNVEENIVDESLPNDTTLEPTEAALLSVKVKVFIVFHSIYGHVLTLAKKVKEGVDSVDGVEAFLYQVPETLSAEVLAKMNAPPRNDSIPTITSAQLVEADAFLFGIPTRFGTMSAQMKTFFDSTGALWKTQSLAGKPAGIFGSTGSQGGGQETTALTTITQLTHHGMLYVPIGYTFGAGMFKMDELRGGSPYGAGTYAGTGSRMPTETELAIAEHQGKLTAQVAKLLAKK